ncbi:MAG: response regulator transcription factor [Candidatus Moranbacteria bacterium]|nr:response regulator transcription factor [Candidatus Moranbacteria bacterium]
MINCIIIEDEPLAAEKLTDFIGKTEYLNLSGVFHSPIAAMGFLKNNTIDLIFLDIEMKELTGIQLMESVKIDSKIIITSAYEKYALKGFELQVCDYLLKPITFERFIKACDKVMTEVLNSEKKSGHRKIFIKTEYRLEGLDSSEILFVEGIGDYRKIVTEKKTILTLQNFKEIASLLPQDKFRRVHNSFIVSFDKIDKIERKRIYIRDQVIPVSDSYYKEFLSELNSKP